MSSSKMKLSESALAFLPKEILVQILSKLPAKSLVRFKCVSKFFCSLIVDHSFADLHRNWSLTLPSRMSVLISLPFDLEDARFHCSEENQGTLARFHYTINYSEENQGTLDANRLLYMDRDRNLLGFDSVSRRYKVLKSVQFNDHDRSYRRHVSIKHWVFTLGVDESWREIHSAPSYHPYTCFNNQFYFHTSVHIDGVIYFLNSLNKGEIVAFDVRAENFRAILPPPPSTIPGLVEGPPGVGSGRSGLVEVDGRLAIVDLFISDNRDNLWRYGMAIWILEESMVWKNQYLIFIPIPFEEIDHDNKKVLFVATNHVGEIAVLVKHDISVSILFYNFRRQSWRKFDISKLPMEPSMYPAITMPGFDMITARIRDSFRSSRRPDHVISVLENNEMVTVGWVKTHVFVQIPHERVLITLFHRVNGGYPLSSEEDEPMVENVDEPVYAPLYESHAFVVHFGHMDKVFDMLKEHEHVSFRIVGPEAYNPADLHVLARITYRNMFDIHRRDQIYMHVQDQVDVPQSIWHGIRYHQNLLFHITCESLRSLFHSFHLLSGQENITRMLISKRGIELRARELPSRIMHIVPVDMGEGEVEYTVSSTVLDPLLRIFSGGNATFYALDGPRLLVKVSLRGEDCEVTVLFQGED
nr:putative F-box protein At3g52320 [Ipomoea batatas]